ncbi:hypothetical protein PCC7805_00961 [Planktothrix agardhii]|uniref:ParB/Sulfiredoxin domain-containing protein n=1 Tax=Planktothrix agardhii TaxID=1160 RepID=A0A1J1JK39_PLAAG|nr:Rho termination factor [Planktothrix agardhii]CAD5925680.1 hypothetical protein PCC7805_00961 [Planktothrix agardhii]CUM61343.1 conserved protein of unknown function [Planktothrix agardhii]
MSDFDNIGKLMHLPLIDIEPGQEITEPEFFVSSAAEAILQANGRNWVPVIVQEIADYQYQAVSNHFVYAAAQKAQIERVWCIVIDPKPSNIEQAKILTRETNPLVNLCTASRDTIIEALRYLQSEPGSPLKTVDLIKVTNPILESNRETWADFNELIKLKCGITKGKKLDCLKQVFYCKPLPIKEIPPAPEPVSIKKANRDQIFERINYLSINKIDGFDKIDPDQLADTLFTTPKGKWKSLNPILNLDCGVSKNQIQKTLKTVFSL